MRYATFSLSSNAAPRLGAVVDGRMVDVASVLQGHWSGDVPTSLLALIDQGPDAWARASERLAGAGAASSHDLKGIHWHAPIPRPRKNVFCLGLNYKAHAAESARAKGIPVVIPTIPVFFTKVPTTVSGPFADVAVDRTVTAKVDWEVELGVVVGRAGRNIRRADALAHVFGYTGINDLSARDLQSDHLQWFKGKSLDGFCPMGPVVVTADEFGDPQTRRVQCRVNGETRQDSNTADMIFPVDLAIEWLSKGLTLEAGDVIATGTPEGVGMGRTPQEFLSPGDVVETEVEGIGTMRNRIVAAG